jgi:hypothetical protein
MTATIPFARIFAAGKITAAAPSWSCRLVYGQGEGAMDVPGLGEVIKDN